MQKKRIPVEKIIERFSLEVLAGEFQDKYITVSDIKRPGIELAGYWDFFTPERVQMLGKTEISFLEELDPPTLEKRIKKFLSYDLCCVVVARNLQVPEMMVTEAKRRKIPLLRTSIATTRFLSLLTNYLEEVLAPEKIIHGVLIDIYGMGVLIKGQSGIGKSETAIELVKRGHRLVADDLIRVKKIGERLRGSAPEVSRYFLEMRGIGIINVRTLFGAGAVKDSSAINLVAKLEYWDENKVYDRLGLENSFDSIMEVKVPQVIIPVKPGRNLALVLEVAAMNMRMKAMGYNAARDFVSKVNEMRD